MSIQRNEKWQTALHNFIEHRRSQPFSWGTNDCSLFAADAIQAITGTDIADDFRTGYHDQASAFALIKSVTGGTTVADAAAYCAAKHGLTEYKYPLLAKRGDLVIIANADGQLIAGVVGLDGRHAISVGETGMTFLLITQVKRAWSV